MVAIKEVLGNDDIVVVTTQGVVIRQPAETIRVAGRNTQGVRLIRLDGNDKIADTAVVPSEEEKELPPDQKNSNSDDEVPKQKANEKKESKPDGKPRKN
jgi:DNA gyrase subunit A